MTPQKQEQADPMFHYFQMEDLVPEDHILRHGMGRARYRGLASLNEQLNLVAAVQNLKRLVSFIRRGKASMCALSVKDSASCSSNSSYSLLTRTLIRLFCLFHSKTIRYATL